MTEKLHILALGYVNAYLLENEGSFILIDTGVPSRYTELRELLIRFGCRPGLLKLIILTHGDPDHAGGSAQLRREYDAPIAIHAGDAAMLEQRFMPLRQARTLMMKWIVLLGNLRKPKREADAYSPDLYLSDGQLLSSFGSDARALHTPGHTKGSICILTRSGDLIAGDTLLNISRPSGAALIEDEAELQASLERLFIMPIDTVYPGHGKAFSGDDLRKLREAKKI